MVSSILRRDVFKIFASKVTAWHSAEGRFAPGTMATDDEEELLRSFRAQNRSVSFVTGSDSVNIDLCEDPHRRDEGSELSQTVCYNGRIEAFLASCLFF